MAGTPVIDAELPEREKKISDNIAVKFGEDIISVDFKPRRIKVNVKQTRFGDIARYLNDHLGLDHVVSVSGVDYVKENEIEVVYHVASYGQEDIGDLVIALAVRLPRDDAKTPSLIELWPGAEYMERETFEMIGVVFEGHPRMERLILPEDWNDIPPLRKDFKNPGR
jgi:NADH:ubiquinone oxidoreductase subunit C